MEPPRDTELLQLVFSGECLQGHDPKAVRTAVVAALKLDERRAARLFSGRRVVLRRAVDVPTAHRTIVRFAMLGAVVRAETASAAPLPTEPPTGPPLAVPPPTEPPLAVSPPTEPSTEPPTEPSLAAPPPTESPLDVTAASPVAQVTAPASPQPVAAAAVPWGCVLRWTGMGMAGSVAAVLLGLLLGPGLGTLWPEAPAPADTAPVWRPAVEARPAPPSVPYPTATDPPSGPSAHAGAAGPAAVADAALPPDMTPEARHEYRQRYLPASGHKAFAVSSARLHAWHAGAASADEAREAALAGCMAALRPGDDGCRVVDADGELLE